MKRLLFALIFASLLISCSGSGVISPPNARSLKPGMMKEDVIRSVGQPQTVDTTVAQPGISTRWEYHLRDVSAQGLQPKSRIVNVYFHKGMLVTVQK